MVIRSRQSRFCDSNLALISVRTQLDILARLLCEKNDYLVRNSCDNVEFLSELDSVFSLVDVVSNKVELLYGYASMECQLPSSDSLYSESQK